MQSLKTDEKGSTDEKTSKHCSTNHSFGNVDRFIPFDLHVQLWWSVVLFHVSELVVDPEFDSQHSRNMPIHTLV